MAFDRIIKYGIIYSMTPDKEKYYENATRKLINAIDKMKMGSIERVRAKNLTLLFRDSFKLPDVKQATFSQETDVKKFTYDSDGFCRVSSINFALMMGENPNWQVMYIDDLWTYGPHHFLMHMPSKSVLDLTYDQYTHSGIEVPYYLGQPVKYALESDAAATRFAHILGLTPLTNKQNN